MAYTAVVAQYKKDLVSEFARLLKDYPIIAAVNMESLPAKQLQKMRTTLRSKQIVLKMAKRRIIKIAIERVKSEKAGIENLIPQLTGMPALIFAKENPFALYNLLQKSKSKAPARAGQTAPMDIIVPAGPTSFAPGPVIGELGQCGIKAGIEGGKVVIKQDSLVAKAGEQLKANVAAMLTRLGIEPMEIGLNITAVYEKGEIFKRDVLAIDEDAYKNNLLQAHQWAFNLAVEAGIYNKDTTEFMVTKAFADARALALAQDILTDKTVGDIFAKAERQALVIKSEANL
ncbi:TPA: 50S ribosomal protein L10 [Candidatus Woesearchaeota archaeon]|nr:MAG: large subunit ribosomal protein L10 [archaeon GW2011_AR16]HIG96186.1 50S ribosomal protein L10 [Candidatus Woesearchaeota archaeon]HIH47024.1 50S ribosomal protein L10 [Candidatus Woesearchaeota archaeon]